MTIAPGIYGFGWDVARSEESKMVGRVWGWPDRSGLAKLRFDWVILEMCQDEIF